MSIAELTDYQMKFVDAFMETGNKVEALMAAGYEGKGNPATVSSLANRVYRTPKVYGEIERRRKMLADMNIVDSRHIVSRLTKMFNGELSTKKIYKDGSEIEEPISFRNQIEAGKLLVSIYGMQAQLQSKPEERADIKKMADDLKALTQTFLSKRVSKELPEIVEAEDVEVD